MVHNKCKNLAPITAKRKKNYPQLDGKSFCLHKLKTAQLEDEQKLLKSKVEELNLLNKLSFLMSSSLNPEIIFDSLTQNLKGTFNFDIFSVMMLGGKEIFLKVHSNNPIERELLNKINGNIHKSFAKYTGKSKCLNKLPEKTIGEEKKITCVDQSSELDFNLQVAGKKSGVLKVIRFSGEPFSKDLRNFLSTVSNQLAMFLNNALEHKKYLGLASYDCLTNTLNRRTFNDIIEKEFNRSVRYKTPLSVIMLDLDHFKKVNDSWGHQAGDTVLREVAGVVHNCLRESDIFARYGGEEFVAILPQTDILKAAILAERIRMAIENNAINVAEGQIKITSSMGIACYPFSSAKDKDGLVKMADNALYQAKNSGRNCVYIHFKDDKFRELKLKNKTFQPAKITSCAIA